MKGRGFPDYARRREGDSVRGASDDSPDVLTIMVEG
jgi:hypothetical protein